MASQGSPGANAHFLHIGKTGGTAIKHALAPQAGAGAYRLVLHPHATRLPQVPAGEKFFFFLRDPLTRFVSAFYSRQRQGKPRYDSKWSAGEAAAFAAFASANALAEALGDGGAADAAMREIQHLREPFSHWLGDADYFASRRGDLLFVGFQETLERDFDALKRVLGIPADVRLPADPVEAHRNPDGLDWTLSEAARRNLARHYADDIRFYGEMQRRAAAT